jgi:hypothetical protein
MNPKELEREVLQMKMMITEMHALLVLGRKPAPPGAEEYKLAIEAMADNADTTLLSAYLKRGGEVYKTETIWPDAAGQKGRSYVPRRRSAKLPTTSHTPIVKARATTSMA